MLARRNIKQIGSAKTVYVYDGAHVIAEYENLDSDSVADDLARRYIYGPGIDRPVAMIDFTTGTPVWYYYHQDALGNVVALSNNGGNLAESYRYTPFGSVTFYDIAGQPTGASAVKNPYLFTARRYDDETGLYYYRARMYNPQLGRFMQPDPIGYYDAMNLYQYCGNNPVNRVDPSGLMWGWVEAVWNWLTEDAAQTVAEEVVEQAVEKLYVPDGDTSATGECAQAAPKLGIPERIPRGWEGVKECNEQFAAKAAKEAEEKAARKVVEKLRKKAQREFNKNGDFHKWFHRDYKDGLKMGNGKIKNPDMDLGPAYEQWIGEGMPGPSY